MRQVLLVVIAALLAAGCGGNEETAGAGKGAGKGGGGSSRSLTGCLELWNGPHVGSTRMQYVAERFTTFAKVQVKGGRCRVAFASEDAKVYGRYIEKENATGPWTMEADRASAAVARRVVRTANATGHPDGTLSPGAP